MSRVPILQRLLSINNYHYARGGADAAYLQHAELFAQHGWDTSFFSMKHEKNIACEDSDFFVDTIEFGETNTISAAAKIVYSREAQQKIGALLDSKPARLAHVHNIYHHLSPSVLVELAKRGVPTVMTAHDLKLACPNYKMLNRTGICERCKGGKIWNVAIHRCVQNSLPASALIFLESAVHKSLGLYARHLDKIVAPSHFYRDKLIEWGWDGDRVVHIPNAVEVTGSSTSIVGNYLLYFGRLAPEKGLITLIRAAALSGIPVKIAGEGPQDAELRQLAAHLSAPVEFLGHCVGETLWSVVENSRAIVLPSEWYENGPMSVIEAFSRGKPLVGANIGGIPEMIVEGETGWAFESGDVEDLSRAMSLAMDASASQLLALAEMTRQLVAREYSKERYFERMSDLYAQILH